MKPGEISPESRFNERASRLISYGLVAAMMSCAAVTLVNFVYWLSGTWQPWYLAVLVFITTLERLYTHRPFKQFSLFSGEWLAAYTAEWVVLLIVIKLVISLANGLPAFLAEIPLWKVDFARYFLSAEVFASIGVVVVVWVICGYYADLLDDMGLDQSIIKRELPMSDIGEAPARERLLNIIFSMGTLLIVLTALIRINLRGLLFSQTAIFNVQLPILDGGGASTLLYFMFALALLSQSQFVNLQAIWSIQRIPVSREVASRWALYSLGFLLLVTGLASLLPTSYSLGVLNALGYVLGFILSIFIFIGQIIVGIFLFLASMPFLLLGREPPTPKRPVPEVPEARIPPEVTASPAWWEASKTVIFWVLLIAILLFSLVTYLRQHQELLESLKKLKGWGWLASLWSWLANLFGKVQHGIGQMVAAGQKRLRSRRSATTDWLSTGFLNLRRLDPRQKVYFFYMAFLRRSGESGLPRNLSQTPSEFASSLERALPAAEPDIDALTAAFIEARYTPRPVESEQANLVKEVWERIRKVLREKKQ